MKKNIEKSISNLQEEEKIKKEIDKFVKLTSEFFNKENINNIALEEEFSQRNSKITGHLFLSIFVFGISIFGVPTFEQLAGLLNSVLSDKDITRQAIYKRITEKAEKFFEKILSLAIELTIPNVIKLNILEEFKHIIIWDSTSFQLPKELAEYFKGSGGDASNSAIKIQFGYDIKSGCFIHKLQDGTSSDSSYHNNFVELFQKGDLVLRDLGYFNLRGLEELDDKGTYFLSRLHQQNGTILIQDFLGHWIKKDLLDLVYNLHEDIVEFDTYITTTEHRFKARLVIEKLSEQMKNERLRKLRKTCQKQQRPLTKRAKILAGFNFFISNIDKKYLPMKQFRLLYAVRWQVELVFKSWKSNFSLHKFKSTKIHVVKTFLYAKLIFIFLTSKIIQIAKSWVWKNYHKEVSEFRAHKYFKTIALKWMFAIVKYPDTIENILFDALKFISQSCIKQKKGDRKLPCEILDKISDISLSNPLDTTNYVLS